MTTLRETLAKALIRRKLGLLAPSANDAVIAEAYADADAVIRSLAAWEPSDEALRAMEWEYATPNAKEYEASQLEKRRAVAKAVLRVMAEEGK